MVTRESVEKQLKEVGFNHLAWGRSEVRELPNILMPDEKIFECVNGIYEGGFALLIATNLRMVLIDKKPLNYLTVEDLRFDMISELDYSHRLLGARISITAGSKNLKFTSYNQPRLRKLISHVQHSMADNKKQQSEHQEDQNQHLERINQQLQAYLLAQHQQQQKLQEQLQKSNASQQPIPAPEPVQPSPELSDYLYAQSLLMKHQETFQGPAEASYVSAVQGSKPLGSQPGISSEKRMADLYAEGMQEVFGKRQRQAGPIVTEPSRGTTAGSAAS